MSRIKSRCSDYIDRKSKLQHFYEKKLDKNDDNFNVSRSINDNIFLFRQFCKIDTDNTFSQT